MHDDPLRPPTSHPAAGDADGADGAGGACPVRRLVEEVGRYLAGDDAPPADVHQAGHHALHRATTEVADLVRSAYRPHEVIATELRFASPERGFRRTVFAVAPTPVALMLLCLRTCDAGSDVTVLQHTAGCGTSSRHASWPFGMETAERLTRPPGRDAAAELPAGLDDLAG